MIDLKIRRCITNVGILVIVLLGMQTFDALASDTRRVANQEFRFSVAFPKGYRICTSASGDHPHGFFIRLHTDQKDCGIWSSLSAIGVQAYGNATFETSPDEEIASLCKSSVSHIEKNAIEKLEFVGHRSVQCQSQNADGSIDIYVVTQAGQWPLPHDSPEWDTPLVNYMASLHTKKDRMSEDMKVFRMVLDSVRIEYKK